ncbi:MAG: hypothetical protein AMJ79_12235 [Phycisphaerae bacterium SM23_30]|nr:MAG: hypothetical protein AMJ79_12235 [Phycisphaerae bacterium SM23_30]
MASKTKQAQQKSKTPPAPDTSEASADESAVTNEMPPESQDPAPQMMQDHAPPPRSESQKLDRILSIKVPVIVKIAQKKMTMAEILKLHVGTVIQFDQDAYQHVELTVNNVTIGLGQPVKVGENFGLKVTQIGEITNTIKALKTEN